MKTGVKLLIVAVFLVAALGLALLAMPYVASADGGTNCIPSVGTLDWGGGLPSDLEFRVRVCQPGDSAVARVNFRVAAHVFLYRVVPDDILDSATFVSGSTSVDLLPLLQMGPVTGTVPSDPGLVAALTARGVSPNQLLLQSYRIVDLGNVPVGSYLQFQMHDDAAKAVNRGLTLAIGDAGDNFTVDLSGNKVACEGCDGTGAGVLATWGPNYQGITVTTTTINVTSPAKFIAFTINGSFASASVSGTILDCSVGLANPGQALPTTACRMPGGGVIQGGVTINGLFFEVWPQAKIAALPTGWQ